MFSKMSVSTKNGDVYLGSTATICGEGPNVDGFRFARQNEQVSDWNTVKATLVGEGMDEEQAEMLLVAAEVWAEK
jgi:hypothetical protein